MSQKSGERRKELSRKRRRREQSLKLRAKETKPSHKKKQANGGSHNWIVTIFSRRPTDHFPGLGGHTAKAFLYIPGLKARLLFADRKAHPVYEHLKEKKKFNMKDENGPVFPNNDYRISNWCDSNRDIIEALMDSKELLKKTRELIYQEGNEGELKCGKS